MERNSAALSDCSETRASRVHVAIQIAPRVEDRDRMDTPSSVPTRSRIVVIPLIREPFGLDGELSGHHTDPSFGCATTAVRQQIP